MSWKPFIASQRVRLPPGKGTACQPEACVACGAVTDIVKGTQQNAAFQPFFSNERVSEEDILRGHFDATRHRFAASEGQGRRRDAIRVPGVRSRFSASPRIIAPAAAGLRKAGTMTPRDPDTAGLRTMTARAFSYSFPAPGGES